MIDATGAAVASYKTSTAGGRSRDEPNGGSIDQASNNYKRKIVRDKTNQGKIHHQYGKACRHDDHISANSMGKSLMGVNFVTSFDKWGKPEEFVLNGVVNVTNVKLEGKN